MLTENDILDNVAIVTAGNVNNVGIRLHGETGDSTSYYIWSNIWRGYHYSFSEMKKDCSILTKYKFVLVSGDDSYLDTILKICEFLRGETVVAFLPEGDISLYDQLGINSFNGKIYEVFNAVDVIFSFEEDKIPYYSYLTDTPAVFVHVPLDNKMEEGFFKVPIESKSDNIVVYGDNNPNCPITACVIAKRLKKPVRTVCIKQEHVEKIKKLLGVDIEVSFAGKLSQYNFHRLLGNSWVHIYPTRWIGSAREQIACAAVGTPCIGSDKSHTQKRLFPGLATDIYDVEKMTKLASMLYEDKGFYREVTEYAWNNLSFYNLKNTKERFIYGCEIGLRRMNDKLLHSSK